MKRKYREEGIYNIARKIICRNVKEQRGKVVCLKTRMFPFPSFWKAEVLTTMMVIFAGHIVFLKDRPFTLCVKKEKLEQWCHGKKD